MSNMLTATLFYLFAEFIGLTRILTIERMTLNKDRITLFIYEYTSCYKSAHSIHCRCCSALPRDCHEASII